MRTLIHVYSCQVLRESAKRKWSNRWVVFVYRQKVGILLLSLQLLELFRQNFYRISILHPSAMFCPNPSSFCGDISENVFFRLITIYNIGVKHVTFSHRRRSLVNFRGQDIFARKYMHEKLSKCPNFIRFLPEKNSFCPNLWRNCPPRPPVSYAYAFSRKHQSLSPVSSFSSWSRQNKKMRSYRRDSALRPLNNRSFRLPHACTTPFLQGIFVTSAQTLMYVVPGNIFVADSRNLSQSQSQSQFIWQQQ